MEPLHFKQGNETMKTKSIKNPWDFSCPSYDDRSGRAVNVGWSHGVGKVQPVGHDGAAKMEVSTLPMGKMDTLGVYGSL